MQWFLRLHMQKDGVGGRSQRVAQLTGHPARVYNWNMGIQMNSCSSRSPQKRQCPRESQTLPVDSHVHLINGDQHRAETVASDGNRLSRVGIRVRQGRCLGYKFNEALHLKVGQVQGWCLPCLTWVQTLWARVDRRQRFLSLLLCPHPMQGWHLREGKWALKTNALPYSWSRSSKLLG